MMIEKIIPPLQGLFLLGALFSEAVGLAYAIIPFQGIYKESSLGEAAYL